MQNKDRRQSSEAVAQGPADDAPNASLVEALQRLTEDMAKAASEEDAEAGLKKLRQIRSAFLGSGASAGSAEAARRDAEALISWVEARLEQLHQYLARKRRAQEGVIIEEMAKQREPEAPSLLPTELIAAVVRSTTEADRDRPAEKAAALPASPENRRAKKKPAGKHGREKKQANQAAAETGAAERNGAEQPPEKKQAGAERPAPPPKPEWTKYELLAAHMAASVREDPGFFEKLRRAAKQPGQRRKAPEDDRRAEKYYRTVHDLNKRLVNLELHSKALAAAGEKKEAHAPLLKTAARELKLFMKNLKAGREDLPEMAPELDRLFGGWAEQFRSMQPEKGGELLAASRRERQAGPQAAPAEQPEPRAAEAKAPQLVLKRPDDWQQS